MPQVDIAAFVTFPVALLRHLTKAAEGRRVVLSQCQVVSMIVQKSQKQESGMASRFKVAVTLHSQSRSRAGMDANDSSCSPLNVLLDGLCVHCAPRGRRETPPRAVKQHSH